MISHELKYIFIHIPKTAGTSIEKKFGLFPEQGTKRGMQDHRTIAEIEPLSINQTLNLLFSENRKQIWPNLKNRIHHGGEISPAQFHEYYKFTFVRNPWARTYSWYKNVMRDSHHQKVLDISVDCTLNEFVTKHLASPNMRPQTDWIKDTAGNIVMDFVGRFENLDHDFSIICNRLGFSDSNLPKVMMGDGSEYMAYYDDKSKEIIAKRYAEEIELFGYSFEI